MNDKATATAKTKTFFLGMDPIFAEETLITEAWKAQDTSRKIVYKIPLDKVQPEMVFIPLVRGIGRTPLKAEEFDAVQQRKLVKTRDPKELVKELTQCEPVYVSKFWRAFTNAGPVDDFASIALSGDFDSTGFIDALNRSASAAGAYARTAHGDDHKTCSLTWGA
jgi:hypothetical protein